MTVEQAKYRLRECECKDALYEGFICEGCAIAQGILTENRTGNETEHEINKT